MAIAYKGFHIYLVDPATEAQLAFMGDIVVTFTSATSQFTYPSTSNFQNIIDACTSHGVHTNDILASAGEHPNPAQISYIENLRKVFPATVLIPRNTTWSSCKIKLVNGNGSYLLSTTAIGIGDVTNLNWYIYDKNGNRLSDYSFSWECLNGFSNCTFFGQDGFDGTLKSDKPIWGWKLVTSYGPDYWILNTATAPTTSASDYTKFIDWLNAAGPLVPPDPYEPGGTSGPGGGTDGTFDFTSTDIPIPPLPGIGAYNTGFLTLYKPTAGELNSTAQYMWSGSFDPENFRKLFANPMDAILGLHIVPASGAHPTAAASTLQIGNISTGLSMARVTEQYYELDCGTITISPKWGAYLDYSPYSKLSLYLPYIGIVPISPDDCMGGSIRVIYHVDILSGSCCVYVYCTSNRGADGHTLYTFTGACACDCPVTEGQYTNAVLGILGIAGGVAGAVSAGLSGNAGGITGGIGEAANAALSMVKPDIGRSGNFGGSAGLMGIQYPFLILTIPKMCTPGDQHIYRGYPSFVTMELSELSGYAEIEITHISNMSATAEEVEELRTILEGGVIF